MSSQSIFHNGLVDQADHHSDLRRSVARLMSRFGRGYFQELVRKNERPDELWRELGQAGFLGMHAPEEFGGGGVGMSEYQLMVEEVAAHGCPLLQLVINSITVPIIATYGSDAMKREWLPALASGERKISFGITEPDAGTNTHNVSTTIRRDGDGWLLKGAKYWTSAIDEADAVLVVARDADLSTPERSALSLVLVPTDSVGLSWKAIDSAVMVPEKTFFTFYDDIKLPAEALIGEPGKGLKQVFVGLNPERMAAAAINNGIARFALAQAAQYAVERKVWQVPIGAHQGVSHPLADSYAGVQAARLMTARAADLFDRGEDAAEAANMAKLLAADASLKALDQAIQVHGGNGLSYEYGLADLWFVARLHKTAPVSREMVLNHIAQHSLGLPKSY
ncbi:acyl-CoA dehydrogenase family protein [Sphingomonas sp. ID0503]|uniref:acyl-CoA dehydrogenase family protein n=1 Tax=Sphingomonas sp. ID0503 TaxID=3399691 RepID=UPI003AFA56F9